MADLDRLLSDDPAVVARTAEEAAVEPDFAAVVRRGRARRARRQALALGAAALAVAGIVVSVRLVGPDGTTPSPAPPVGSPTAPTSGPTSGPTDAPSPTEAPAPTDGPTTTADLAATVDATEAGLLDLATTPGAPEQRIALWRGGDEQHWILALTADGFAHRRLVEVSAGTHAVPLGGGRFVLRDGWEGRTLSIIDVAGRTTPVRIDATPAPVAADEVPVVLEDGASSTLVAVAPDGSGHEVPAPADTHDLHAYAGRLTATRWDGGAVRYHWSDDGGASWQQAVLAGSFLPWIADAGAGSPHAVLEGGDGATLFPLLAVDSGTGGEPTAWTRAEVDRAATWPTISGAWIDRDGGLRVLATINREDARRPVDAGVWQVSEGRLTKVPAAGAGLDEIAETGLLTVEDDGGPVLWVAARDGTAWRSVDDGGTWERFATR